MPPDLDATEAVDATDVTNVSAVTAALSQVGRLGGFFPIELEPQTPGWQRFSALLALEGSALQEQVVTSRAALAASGGQPIESIEPRVAASLWFLGWASRLSSPWLGCAVLAGVVPEITGRELLWRPSVGQPVPLAVRAPRGRLVAPTPAGLADAVFTSCISALLEPLLELVADRFALSRRVLWGNVASAVAGGGWSLARNATDRATAAGAAATSAELLKVGALQGAGRGAGATFTRRSCCLLYRVPGRSICADCVLR